MLGGVVSLSRRLCGAQVGPEVGFVVVMSRMAPAGPVTAAAGVRSCQAVITLGLICLLVPSFVATTFATADCRVVTTEAAKSSESSFLPG